MVKRSKTSSFGVSKREGHDSSSFYQRKIFTKTGNDHVNDSGRKSSDITRNKKATGSWCNRIFQQSSEVMPIPDNTVALGFTSPPYNVGKDYDDDMNMQDYLQLITNVGKEMFRVLKPGGRYVINVANLGRKPYIPLHSYFYQIHNEIGFLPMGEIIWQKAAGANGNCAWGSWKSARAPRIRDIHEYLLIFAKGHFSRPDAGVSDIDRNTFMESTLSIWKIPAESARKIGHPAPFPQELAARVVRLYSYIDDVVIDPFSGSGTTCIAAKVLQRNYVGFEINPEYCRLAEKRLEETDPNQDFLQQSA